MARRYKDGAPLEDLTELIEGKFANEALELLDYYDVKVVDWRTRMGGCAFHTEPRGGEKHIACPHPKSEISFAILAHEVGHHVLGHTSAPRRLHRYREEYQAWNFALAAMKELGVPITEKVRDRRYRSVRYALNKAIRRGLKQIPMDIAADLGFDVLTQTPVTWVEDADTGRLRAQRYNREGELVTYDPAAVSTEWIHQQGWR